MHKEKLFAIVGCPLGHSLSPELHSWAFDEIGYPGIYMAFEQKPENLARFYDAVRTLPVSGGNITIPFKVDSMRYVDGVSERAKRIGAMNTFYWKDGRLLGENTDVIGFMAPLRGRKIDSALILGAGGVSRAAIVALQELGVPDIRITNRTPEKASALAEEFGIQAVPYEDRAGCGCSLVINATCLGMKDRWQDMSAFPEEGFGGRGGLAYDIVYTPEDTRFLKDARAHGWECQSGLAMFVEQARAAFRLWTGKDMPSEGAYALVRRALGC